MKNEWETESLRWMLLFFRPSLIYGSQYHSLTHGLLTLMMWLYLVAKFVKNASDVIWWLNLQSMQVEPSGGWIWNQQVILAHVTDSIAWVCCAILIDFITLKVDSHDLWKFVNLRIAKYVRCPCLKIIHGNQLEECGLHIVDLNVKPSSEKRQHLFYFCWVFKRLYQGLGPLYIFTSLIVWKHTNLLLSDSWTR